MVDILSDKGLKGFSSMIMVLEKRFWERSSGFQVLSRASCVELAPQS